MSEPRKNVRSHLRATADNADEAIAQALMDALVAEKSTDVTVACKHCFKQGRYSVEVKDHTNAIRAAEKLVELGYGRAQSEPQGEDTAVSEVRALTDDELLSRRIKWLVDRGYTVNAPGG